jgi:hypothetical protein
MAVYDEAYIERITQVHAASASRLLAIPGVRLVALGSKEVDGVPTGEPVIRVHVRRKRAAVDVPAEELIPGLLDGVPTDVIDPTREAPIAALDRVPGAIMDTSIFSSSSLRSEVKRPLIGGVQLVPNAFVRPEFPNKGAHAAGGTLGCLLRDKLKPDRGFALTCQHVIDGDGQLFIERGDTQVGSPNTSTKSTCCGTDNMIGVYLDGENPNFTSDEAVVTLSAGLRWKPHIIEIGRIPVHEPVDHTQLVELSTTRAQVRKRGARTGLTGGVITDVAGNDGSTLHRIRLRPNDNPRQQSGDHIVFADRGDSGAVLVDDANRVLGMVISRNKSRGEGGETAPGADGVERVLAQALPMTWVLQHLHALFAKRQPPINLTLEVAMSNDDNEEHAVPGGGATVAVPPELARVVDTDMFLGGRDPDGTVRAPVGRAWFAADGRTAQRLADIRAALQNTTAGRRLNALWDDHQRELLSLIEHDRRVTLAWHRGGGAALFQSLIRVVGRPELALPETVSGLPVRTCVDRLAGILIERGSPALAEDLRQLRTVLPDIGARTVPEILVAFGAEPIDLTASAGVGEAGRG